MIPQFHQGGLLPIEAHLVKFARFWITLATKVSFLAILSSGYSVG